MLTLMQFIESRKWLILICCCLSVLISGFALIVKKEKEKPRAFFLFFCAYMILLGLGIIWAVSGRFFLREYSKYLLSWPLVLYIFFLIPRKDQAIRRLLFMMSAVGAFYAILSVDNASTGWSHGLLYLIPGFKDASRFTGFEQGSRLFGIFSNGNISAGLLALCIFLSLYLLESSSSRRQRVFAVIFAALQASTFLFNFSMGATGFFLISAVVYLIFSGERRSCVFLRMLEVALPVAAAVFLSFRFFEVSDSRKTIPMFAVLLSAAVSVVLELAVFPRLSQALEGRKKRAAAVFAAALVLLCAYAAAAFLIRGELEVPEGASLRRSCYPSAGEYSLRLSSEGSADVEVTSQDEQEVIMHTQTTLYSGPASEAVFTVPENSLVVHLTFSSSEGATLSEALLEGPESISLHLGYPLLPGFAANRLQGLFANENAIQRRAFFRDGMKIFRDYPIIGAGLGSFETLLFGYQEFYYETKYVHNHYIQVLLDTGLIGLVLYASLLLLTAAALWRGRRKEAPFRSLHPALCAAFVMIVLHSCMEVVMSASVYLPYALVVFSLAAVCYAPALDQRAVGKACIVIPGAFALVYAVLILLNLSADSSVRKSTYSASRFFSALDYGAKVDVFEKNDWKISYISTCADLESMAYKTQADKYARQLMHVPSNSLHLHLIRYYLVFRDYASAMEAAEQSVAFNYSASDNWNGCFNLFADALTQHPEDRSEILRCVRELYASLQSYEERLMMSIRLKSAAKALISEAQNEQNE